jgi:translation initiation factor 4E
MTDVATAPNPNQQVPLDTIPISPTEGSGDSNEKSSAGATGEGEVRTVFHDPENFNVKHPLMNTWTLWFTKPPSGKVCAPRIMLCMQTGLMFY